MVEEALLDILAHHRDGHAMAAFFIGEETAEVQVHLAAARVSLLHAHQVDVVEIVALVVEVDHAVGEQHGRHVFHRFAALADIDGVLVGQVLTGTLLGSEIGGARPHREFENDNGIRPETAQNACHGRVEAGENRRHSDDRTRPDDHTQYREEGAEFVGADGLERQHQPVEERESRHG